MIIRSAIVSSLVLIVASLTLTKINAAERPPNVILIYCDNLGYGDIGCFGSKKHRTPHVDRMAKEGVKLTSFYSASGVCTPSRAALMTGCYPRRVGLAYPHPDGAVLRPVSPNGLNPDEVTIAEVLKSAGYRTTCVGKWHLGDQPSLLPTRQGFDEFYGIPYSDDMTPRAGQVWPALPLMRGEEVIEAPADRNTLTRRYTAEAVRFITENRAQPFFLYLPHAMPGSTRAPYASQRFSGKSANGPYGDSVEEIDWSTGEILAALKKLGIDEQTLVIWTSDNGAPRRNPPQGSNAPLGGWGYTTMEGGMRVPCVVRWPGTIPAGKTCDELCTTMDLLPTLAKLAGTKPPIDRVIDGKDIRPLLFAEEKAVTPHEAFYYYHTDQLHAVRSGKWKLHLPSAAKKYNLSGKTKQAEAALFDLASDVGETTNVAAAQPEVVARLTALAERARVDLGDGEQRGKNQRRVGRVQNPTPRVMQPNSPVRVGDVIGGHVHPSVCVTKSGKILAVYNESGGGGKELLLSTSADGGKSWSEAEAISGIRDCSIYPGSLTALKDGRVLLNWSCYKVDGTRRWRVPQFCISENEGQDWSQPVDYPIDDHTNYTCLRHPVMQLTADEWVCPFYDRTVVYDRKQHTIRPFGDGRNHGMVPIVQTSAGTIVSGAPEANAPVPVGKPSKPVRGLRSTNGGKSWKPLYAFPYFGVAGYDLTVLENDWVVMTSIVYGTGRDGEWAYNLTVSRDDGETWDTQNPVTVYSPGRPIKGRGWPRTVHVDKETLGTLFYDLDAKQSGGPGVFFVRTPIARLKAE